MKNTVRVVMLVGVLIFITSPMISTVSTQPIGFPKLSSITIQVIPEPQDRLLSIQSENSHIEIYGISPTNIRLVQKNPNLNSVVTPGIWLNYLQFNIKRVGDKIVRQAIAYANNKDEMINRAMLGWGSKENGIIPNEWYPDYVSPRLLEGGDLHYDYNITKANELLDAAGYEDIDNDGIREIPLEKQHLFPKGVTLDDPNPENTGGFRNELRFTIRSLNWFTMSHRPTELLIADIEKIGIKFDLSAEVESVMYPAIFQYKDFDIFTLATGLTPDFSKMLDLFYGPEYYEYGANDCGYDDPEYNALWNDAYTLVVGSNEHIAVVYKMQEMIQEEAIWISWYTGDNIHVINRDITGYENYLMPGGLITDMNIWFPINAYHIEDEHASLKIAFPQDIIQFNPMRSAEVWTEWYEILIYDTLLAYDTDLGIIPWLAEEFSNSNNGLDWSFKIRDGVTWHDGKPLTADDVLWNFKFCYDNEVDRYWPWIKFINRDSLVVIDDTLKFSLTEPNSWFLMHIPDLKIIAPHTYTGGKDYTLWADPHPIGSGPFMFDSRVPGQTIKVVKNPSWWYTRPETVKAVEPNIITVPITTFISTITVSETANIYLITPLVILGVKIIYLMRKRKK